MIETNYDKMNNFMQDYIDELVKHGFDKTILTNTLDDLVKHGFDRTNEPMTTKSLKYVYNEYKSDHTHVDNEEHCSRYMKYYYPQYTYDDDDYKPYTFFTSPCKFTITGPANQVNNIINELEKTIADKLKGPIHVPQICNQSTPPIYKINQSDMVSTYTGEYTVTFFTNILHVWFVHDIEIMVREFLKKKGIKKNNIKSDKDLVVTLYGSKNKVTKLFNDISNEIHTFTNTKKTFPKAESGLWDPVIIDHKPFTMLCTYKSIISCDMNIRKYIEMYYPNTLEYLFATDEQGDYYYDVTLVGSKEKLEEIFDYINNLLKYNEMLYLSNY